MKTSRIVVVLPVLLAASLSACAGLSDRRQFAGHVAESSAPILKGYRACIQKDGALNDDDKRMRLRLADEFDKYVQEGQK